MRDILDGGVLVQAAQLQQPFRFNKPSSRRRIARRFECLARRGLRVPEEASATQPGQLSSPHLRSGFGSLAVH